MADMLVKLYELPPRAEIPGVKIRKAMAHEVHKVLDWVESKFSVGWRSETSVAIHRGTCFIATHEKQIVGFSCYDATALGFFGPEGVDPSQRKKGLGQALLLAALHSMREAGYAYAIIGSAGPVDFYKKCVGATIIEGSKPGIYPTDL